jgi:hypothetical protein
MSNAYKAMGGFVLAEVKAFQKRERAKRKVGRSIAPRTIRRQHWAMLAFIKDIAANEDCCTCAVESWHGQGHSATCIQEYAGQLVREIEQ